MSTKKVNIKKMIKLLLSMAIICLAGLSIILVVRYDRQSQERLVDQSDALIERRVFLEDKEFSALYMNKDIVYAGGTEGVYKINTKTNEIEEVINGDKSFEVVRAIDQSEDGTLWVGHGEGLTGLVNDLVIKHFDEGDGLPDSRINDIKIDRNIIYVATFGGVGVIDGTKVSAITHEDGLIKNITKVLLIDSRGDLWCGSYTSTGGGVTVFSEKEGQKDIFYFTTKNGLTHNAITTIAENNQGDIWVGNGSYTVGGATRYRLKDGSLEVEEVLTVEEGLIGDKVRFIYCDDHNNQWFCSESNGIAVVKSNGDITYLTQSMGLSDNEVKKIIGDKEGNLWLASRRGVTKIVNTWVKETFE